MSIFAAVSLRNSATQSQLRFAQRVDFGGLKRLISTQSQETSTQGNQLTTFFKSCIDLYNKDLLIFSGGVGAFAGSVGGFMFGVLDGEKSPLKLADRTVTGSAYGCLFGVSIPLLPIAFPIVKLTMLGSESLEAYRASKKVEAHKFLTARPD